MTAGIIMRAVLSFSKCSPKRATQVVILHRILDMIRLENMQPITANVLKKARPFRHKSTSIKVFHIAIELHVAKPFDGTIFQNIKCCRCLCYSGQQKA